MVPIFKTLEGLKQVATILSIVVAIGASTGWIKQKQETSRVRSNYEYKETQWRDEKGRFIKEVTEKRITIQELKVAAKSDSTKLSDNQKELKLMAEEVKGLNIKLKDVENFDKAEFEVKDSVVTKIKYIDRKLEKIEPIRKKYMDIDFDVRGDEIAVKYAYRGSITLIDNKKVDKYTKSGKKRIFIARWINPRYTYWTTAVSEDPNAEIKVLKHIKVQKNKGKRK